MANRIRRTKPAPNHPDGWDTTVPPGPAPIASAPEEPSLEDTLYRILREAFVRSDAAARATARLDYQLAIQQATEPPEEDEEPKSTDGGATMLAAGTSREFDDREFTETFERLSFIRMVIDLVETLNLQPIQSELLQALIDDRFRTKAAHGRPAPESNIVAGSDMAVLLHNMKRAAERRARTEPKTKPSRTVAK